MGKNKKADGFGGSADAKAARLRASNSKFGAFHKHPRRTSRPIIEKGNKSARLAQEAANAVIVKAQQQIAEVLERVKRFEKLLVRQNKAGSADAARTQEQINELRGEIGVLQELLMRQHRA